MKRNDFVFDFLLKVCSFRLQGGSKLPLKRSDTVAAKKKKKKKFEVKVKEVEAEEAEEEAMMIDGRQ